MATATRPTSVRRSPGPTAAVCVTWLLLGLSGCLSSPPAEPTTTPPTPGPGCSTEPADEAGFCPAEAEALAVSAFNVTGSACRDFVFAFRAPVAATSVQYPEGLRRRDSDGLTEGVSLHLWTCKQADVAGQIRNDFQVAYLGLAIARPEKVDASFKGTLWVPQFYTSSPELQENASKATLPMRLVTPIVVSESVASSTPKLTSFEFSIPGVSGTDYGVSATRQETNAAVQSKHALMTNATHMVALEFEGRQRLGSGPGSLEAGASSYWGQHSSTTTQTTDSAGTDEDLTLRLYFGHV